MQLLLPFVGLAGGLQPLRHLLGHPQCMVRAIQHMQHKGSRVTARPVRQIVLRPTTHLDCLRRQALTSRAKRCAGVHLLHLRLASCGDLFAELCWRRLRTAIRSAPLQARAFDPEVIADAQIKGHHLGVQHDLFQGLATRHDARRSIFGWLNVQH